MYDVNVIGGFCVARNLKTKKEATHYAKECSLGNLATQIIDIKTGWALVNYKNGKRQKEL